MSKHWMPSERRLRPWRPGFWQHLPWSGTLALIAALACASAAVAVAFVADDKPVDFWKVYGHRIQPTVLLSVLVTLANLSLRCAYATGTAISWWTVSIRGTPLEYLHSIHEYSQGCLSGVRAGLRLNRTTLASFLMLLLLMDGPFLQRAITVVNIDRRHDGEALLDIASLPIAYGYTGYCSVYDPHCSYTSVFSDVLKAYNSRRPIQLPSANCGGVCTTEVIAAGWDVSCRSWTTPYRLQHLNGSSNWPDCSNSDRGCSLEAFSTNITVDETHGDMEYSDIERYGTQTSISIVNKRKSTLGVNGDLTWRECKLRESLMRYPITITNDNVTLRWPWSENRTESIIKRGLSTRGRINQFTTTFGGLAQALQDSYNANATLKVITGPQYSVTPEDSGRSSMYMNPGGLYGLSSTWSDPVDDILSMIHELTFRTAMSSTVQINAKDTSWYIEEPGVTRIFSPNISNVSHSGQSVKIDRLSLETIYRVNKEWLVAGVAVIWIVCFGVLPTFWGWWTLGRPVSMNPLEIAKAFDAPLFREADHNATASELVESLEGMSIRYNEEDEEITEIEKIDMVSPAAHPSTEEPDAMDSTNPGSRLLPPSSSSSAPDADLPPDLHGQPSLDGSNSSAMGSTIEGQIQQSAVSRIYRIRKYRHVDD